MNIYNSIPVIATQLGLAYDDVLFLFVFSSLSLLALLSFGVSFSMDVGGVLYKFMKRVFLHFLAKAKKKEP